MEQWIGRHRWTLAVTIVGVGLLVAAGTIFAQPPVPHAVMPDGDCLSCHQAGAAGATRLAWDHLGRSNEDCGYCHEVSGAPAGVITHPIVGRENCLSCHREGVGTAPRLTANHVDFANDSCLECHNLSRAATEPAPLPTPTPAPSPEAGPAPPATGVGSCASCHQLIFADEQHAVFTGQPLGDPEAGVELYTQLCADCHGEDGETPVGEEDKVINSEDYWGSNDDATILRDIGSGSHGQMTAFAQESGGPLSWDQILSLAGHIRSWGPLASTSASPVEESPTYSGTIGPVLTERCGECHGGIAGLTVTEYDALMSGGDSGSVVVPGAPGESLIVQVQRGEHYTNLHEEELKRLIEWIANGAPES
ncbi:MAG: c-type cytochrome [Anaerolineae bacterium]